MPVLTPGDAPRGPAWRRWLLRSFPGRLLLLGVVVKLLVRLVGVINPDAWRALDVVDGAASLALIFVAAYALTRIMFWAKRRLLWRVRRKLILSYIFVGLVPGLVIIAFFMLAGMLLFFNVSSYLVQSRVRTLIDQARFLAQAVALEADHDEPPPALMRRLQQRQMLTAERFPFTSIALIPVKDLKCADAPAHRGAAPPLVTIGPWQHLPPPTELPRWVACDGFAGLIAYDVPEDPTGDDQLVVRAVAIPRYATPEWAVVVDLPFSVAIEERLREETGISLAEFTATRFASSEVTIPRGRLLESRPQDPGDGATVGAQEWVAFLDYFDWPTGASSSVTVKIRLNLGDIYDRISRISASPDFNQRVLFLLAVIGVLFLVIQFIAVVIGSVLARQITGAVHDLFTGTEHLRNRNFSHQIPVRARDQLGELADSFNVMTREVTKLLRENLEKARMEQEMLAAREIQQKLLPSGPLSVPGLGVIAFCEPAREVAGDYYDLLRISDTKIGVVIADVSGKGLPAGLYMAQLKILAQSLSRVHLSPKDFLMAINRVVADNIDSKSFITMSYGVVDFERREMVYARAGHCPLIYVPGAAPPGMRKAQVLAPDGLVLGLKLDEGQMFDAMIQEMTIPLGSDDLLVFFTDGISETMNEAFDCYGESRLTRVLEQYAHLPFEQLRSFIFADLKSFAGEADQHDDMTMILLKVEPATETRKHAAETRKHGA